MSEVCHLGSVLCLFLWIFCSCGTNGHAWFELQLYYFFSFWFYQLITKMTLLCVGFSLACVCAMVTVAGNGCLWGETGVNASLFNVHVREEGVLRAFYNGGAVALSIIWCRITFANQSMETWQGWEVQWLRYLPIRPSPDRGHQLTFHIFWAAWCFFHCTLQWRHQWSSHRVLFKTVNRPRPR